MENIEVLIKKLEENNISLSSDKLDRLEKYVELLNKWNSAYNLVGKSTLNEIYTRHILDSLQLIPFIKDSKKVLDFGAGAGIPSVILAICLENVQFTACERIGKKCQFLNQVRRELKLENFQVVNDDVRTVSEEFDVITCRAVASIDDIMDLTADLRRSNQRYVLLKGRNYKNELKALEDKGVEFTFSWVKSLVEEDSVVLDVMVK